MRIIKRIAMILLSVCLLTGCSGNVEKVEKEKGKLFVNEFKAEKYIAVPKICQYPTLPTGCETTAAVMVLKYYGEKIGVKTFANKWLSKSSDFYTYNDVFYGPNPDETFVGDPFTAYGYGCYAPVITESINNNSKLCKAKTVYKAELEEFCEKYIDKGQPVLIWATMDMCIPKRGKKWILPNGEKFTWISGEHCLVLIGYDNHNYYFNDPLSGTVVDYAKEIVKERYKQLGEQAVIITAKEY